MYHLPVNTVSITSLRQDATAILDNVNKSKKPAFIFQRSSLKAVILGADQYYSLEEVIEDYYDGLRAQEIAKEPGGIEINEYIAKRWGKKHGSKAKTVRTKAAR